ncbi:MULTISPECIES: MutH/Sau3AI family endonuclease [Neisseria]|uniref:Type-2 restriction enzyme Sau3AI n=1 Tax=Neisseria weaveri TaxID=28091 RepID=A0A3S4YN64_9NEIS|nr:MULTISPECIES: MutH/Sau3AI family endonuclease [Neisseria]SAY50827.1 Type-2 restriction enzyme Sau3AI [Neisseria weaveri]VEJ49151.1 Type-2 restriction enzyme Sau3AI [Neisseria weaveri]
MERREAIERMQALIGRNLHDLAAEYGVTVYAPSGKVNKGWAGHVVERFLELPLNSAQSPNFGSWELKSVPLKTLRNGNLAFKETMAVTMIDPVNVCQKDFEDSHLLSKLKKAVVVARTVGRTVDDPSFIHDIVEFDLDEGTELYTAVKADYDLVRQTLLNPSLGFNSLTGKMGRYIQPRTKGSGHGSTTRAFYARPVFLAQFINLQNN